MNILRVQKLTIVSETAGAIVVLGWRSPGVASVILATENMRPAVDRWLQHGVQELVEEDGSVVPRVTTQESPEFLPRLKAYLERQFPLLRFELTEVDG